jgi:hypothetical protein
MKPFAGVSVLVALTLGLSAWLGSQRANAGVIWPPTEKSSGFVLGGRARCTATVSSEVQAGQAVKVRFVLHNVSRHSVQVSLGVFGTSLVVKAADGTTYDTGALLAGVPVPPALPKKLRGKATWQLAPEVVPVRWRGPLQVTPECLGKALPVLRVGVTAPWPRPAPSAVAGKVVAAAGHLLDNCRPQTAGVAVLGQIDPPSGSTPPMHAQCSLSLSSEGTFWVAHVLVLIPSGLTGVQIFEPYETLWPIQQLRPLEASPPYEAIAWAFVVTRDRTTPVAASTLTASKDSGQMAPYFDWSTAGGKPAGEASCGGTGFSWGGTEPDIEFISVCPA